MFDLHHFNSWYSVLISYSLYINVYIYRVMEIAKTICLWKLKIIYLANNAAAISSRIPDFEQIMRMSIILSIVDQFQQFYRIEKTNINTSFY